MKSWFWLCVAGLLASFTGSAKAATSVAVLGVRAIDGDTELERRLSIALREAVAAFDDLAVSDRELSVEQMALAHGCEEPDAPCLAEIARTLGVEQLFFGTVQSSDRGYELALTSFDAKKGAVENATLRQLAPEQLASSGAARATTSKLVQRLTGRLRSGYVIVTSTAKIGEVHVDGVRRGTVDETGVFTLELPTGDHLLELREPGERSGLERPVRIRPGESTRVNFEVEPSSPAAAESERTAVIDEEVPLDTPKSSRRSLRRIFGWVSVGIGAVFLGSTIYTWVRLRNIADDPDYKQYRQSFPKSGAENGVKNVCVEADKGTLAMRDPTRAPLERSALDLCREGDKLEVLQYVLLGGAVAGAGVGTYLLLSARKKERAELTLRPRFNGTSALLEASVSF